MKKKYLILFIFIILLLPVKVLSSNQDIINNYYIQADVLENGDLLVRELFVLDGQYNGYERIINFKNPNLKKFDGEISSFEGSDIYNGDDIELIKIMAISIDNNLNFDYFKREGEQFEEVNSAMIGDYGYYTVEKDNMKVKYKIFNPSSSGQKGFIVEYIIKNIAISHHDIAEIGLNLFTEEQREIIRNFEMIVNISSNQNELRVWGHGPLNGETDIIDKTKISYKINNLASKTPIDIRFVFDNDVLTLKQKETGIKALEKILTVEQIRAEEANIIREKAKATELNRKRLIAVVDVLKTLWLIGLVYIMWYVYNKHDKEYQSTFKTKYYRDFPADYGPATVGYLLNRGIGTKEISATILDLIARKHIQYKTLGKNKYELIYIPDNDKDKLTDSEKQIIKMLFENIGIDNKVTILEINKYAKKNYQLFLNDYNNWRGKAMVEAEQRNFYENKNKIKVRAILYALSGLLLPMIVKKDFDYYSYPYLEVLMIIAIIISIIYFSRITKRSKMGQDHYLKWKGLDRFLKDFGKFEARDLPQIELWEKYLVYAVVFGTAKKLSKSMKIKFTELPENSYTIGDYLFDIHYINMLNGLNNNINQGITRAVNNALSTKSISESRSSSSGGYGGGFSGGGGSFGGGGGGGRF